MKQWQFGLTLPVGWMPAVRQRDTQHWGHSTGSVHDPDRPQGRQNLLEALANFKRRKKPMDIS